MGKAIYGLNQAARAWYIKISQPLKELNFIQSTADTCLFTRTQGENTIYIIVYADDILIVGSDEEIQDIINKLKTQYTLEDLGEINIYLGIKIEKTHNGFKLNQTAKIEEIAKKINFEDSKPYNTPMETGFQRLHNEVAQMQNNIKYVQAIGALLYVTTISRPEILVHILTLSGAVFA